MEPLFWSVLLLLLALVLFTLELFVPSGAMLAVLSAAAAIGAVVLGFQSSFRAGTLVLLTITLAIPAILAGAIKWWPRTPLGRLIMIQRPGSEDEVLPAGPQRELHRLIGEYGRARSKLLPCGDVVVVGQTFDAVSEGMPIEPGQTIKVVGVRMHRLVVRGVEEKVPEALGNETNVLDRPADLDPFQDPLA